MTSCVTIWGGKIDTTYASSTSKTTYYSQLDGTSKDIYDAIKEMATSGDLKQNKDKEITSLFTFSNFKDYQNGSKSVLESFAKARDAYYLDHPEIFYVNFDNLSIGIYQKGSDYVAYINSGRTGNYLNGFSSENEITSAETSLNSEISSYKVQIDAAVAKLIATDKDYAKKVFGTKVRTANSLLAGKVQYSFESGTASESYIRTSYGALVKNRAVCEGFARAYKLVMDKVGVDCQIVIGYYINGDNYEPHAWNKVCYNGKWYLVDPTFSVGKKDTTAYELLGSQSTTNYVEDNYVSNSNLKFSSKSLATYDFGIDEITTTVETKKDETKTYQVVHYAYNDKNAKELKEQDNLYVVARHQSSSGGNWNTLYAIYNYYAQEFTFDKTHYNVQFFVVKEAPSNESGMYTKESGSTEAKSLDELTVIAESEIVYNDYFNITSLVPVATNITPNNSGRYPAEEPLEISVTYDMDLKLVCGINNVTITPTIKKNIDGKISDEPITDYTKIEDIAFDGKNKVSFKFTPSLQYAHDSVTVYFNIFGIVAKDNDVAPRPISFNFNRKWTVCSKVYDGGRLYMDVYGAPVLIDNKDLSASDFVKGKTADGNIEYYSQNQRSQMMLVATKVAEDTSKTMVEQAESKLGENVKVLSSSTYELDLHICGTVATIPEGSYMRLAFGFPEGYSKDDAGVTFKVYHYTKDSSGTITGIEEIPCVVTEYGLVATVTSFSPYAVVAVKTSDLTINDENKKKSVYSYIVAGDGQASAKVGEESVQAIASVGKDGKVVYTFSPKDNEKIDFVLLNKNKVAVKEENNAYTLELSYNELQDNNVLQVAFVDKDVADKEVEMGLTNLNLSFTQNEKTKFIDEVSSNFTVKLIIAMVVAFCAIATIGIVTILNEKKKKQAYQDNKNKK